MNNKVNSFDFIFMKSNKNIGLYANRVFIFKNLFLL